MWRHVFIVTWFSLFSAIAHGAGAPVVLFREVNVVELPQGRIAKRQDVLIRNSRIERIVAAARDGGAGGQDVLVVEGRDRFLMPGLIEGHAHVPGPRQKDYAADVLLLYLAHGVTTIRGMLGDPWHLELRAALERGEVLGPRLFTSGPSINGKSAPEPERAIAMVREQASAGFDFLKLHPGLTLPVFEAIAATARERDITFQGHVSDDVGVPRALAARQRAIDHLDGYVQALSDPGCLSKVETAGFFGIALVHCADEKRIAGLVRDTRAAGTWMVPTQILVEQWALPPDEQSLRARPAVRYVTPQLLEQWLDARRNFLGIPGLTPESAQRFVSLRRELIRAMHDAGVPILLGSDAPQIFNVPGDSTLEELRVYVESGLSPAEALTTGTVNAAKFFDTDRFGQVRAGAEADLLLLDANPLEDPRALRRLAGVMVRGRWLPREELDEHLEELAARNAARAPKATSGAAMGVGGAAGR